MNLPHKNRFRRFWLRFKIAWRIAFKEKHIVAIYLSDQDILHLVSSEPQKIKRIDYAYAGMMDFYVKAAIMRFNDMIDPTEVITDKAEFEAAVSEKLKIKE